MIKLDEGSFIISGTYEDVQSEYLMITESLLKGLTPLDKYVLFMATAREFVKSFEVNEEE